MKTETTTKNPYAFACTNENEIQEGMTLRDYFANSAMNAIITNTTTMQEITKTWNSMNKNNRLDFEEGIAKLSFNYADAMLKQREL